MASILFQICTRNSMKDCGHPAVQIDTRNPGTNTASEIGQKVVLSNLIPGGVAYFVAVRSSPKLNNRSWSKSYSHRSHLEWKNKSLFVVPQKWDHTTDVSVDQDAPSAVLIGADDMAALCGECCVFHLDFMSYFRGFFWKTMKICVVLC